MSSKRSKRSNNDRLLGIETGYDDEQSSFLGNSSTTAPTSKRRKWILCGIVLTVILIVVAIGVVIYMKKDDDGGHGGGNDELWENIRLPTDVIPVTYFLEYTKVNRVDFYYIGMVNISLNIANPVNTIILHSKLLNITKTEFKDANGNIWNISNEFAFTENDYYVLQFDENIPMQSGAYLALNFNGTLNDGMHGFYRSSYNNSDNQIEYMAVTQFEPTDARMAFPCFDEPSFKANFTVRITAELSVVILSNMEIEKDSVIVNKDASTQTVTFSHTPPMSTYLVAFAIGELVNQTIKINQTIKTDNTAETLIRVFADPHKANQIEMALHIASNVTTAFAGLIDIPYTLPKQDQLAVNDFSAGAMENWGLITYRETALLYNSTISSESDLQRAASTIAHEIAHQWTGDLVTMKFWNELWLNEGFATFLSYLGVDAAFPDWHYMESFVTGSVIGALAFDSSPTSHPIVRDVSTPPEISSMFDTITYDKGGSILRMMYKYFTPDVFISGLHDYLSKYSYGNTVSEQFFESIHADGVDTVTVMMPWVTQAGYPLLTISEEISDDSISISVTQSRFFDSASHDPDDSTWYVPIIWRIFNNDGMQEKRAIMAPSSPITISIPVRDKFDFIKMNLNQSSFCRVQYSNYTWDRLITAINKPDFGGLTTEDRTGLWSDTFALGYSKIYSWSQVLNFTQYLQNEVNLYPWAIAMSSLNSLFTLTKNALRNDPSDPGTMGIFESYMADILLYNITKKIKEDGWVSRHDHQADILTALIFSSAVRYNVDSAVDDAYENLFKPYMHDYPYGNATIWPEISNTVFRVGVMQDAVDGYNFVFDLYENAQTQADRERFLFALSNTKDDLHLKRLLKLSLDSSVVRKGDAATLIRYVAQNPKGLSFAQTFVCDNLQQIDQYLSSGFGGLSRIITAVIAPIADSQSLQRMQDALGNSPIIQNGAAKATYDHSVAIAQENIRFASEQVPEIQQWFAALT